MPRKRRSEKRDYRNWTNGFHGEIAILDDGEGVVEFVVEAHEEHCVQGVEESDAPTIETVSIKTHQSHDLNRE